MPSQGARSPQRAVQTQAGMGLFAGLRGRFFHMLKLGSRGTVTAFRYEPTPMTDDERALLDELGALDEGDRDLILKLVKRLAALRTSQEKG